MTCNVREIMGDWALDMRFPGRTVTIYFNSRQNALNVKRLLEVDDSIPNAATVCDMVEVVRCKDCKLAKKSDVLDGWYYCRNNRYTHRADNYCGYGKRGGEQ